MGIIVSKIRQNSARAGTIPRQGNHGFAGPWRLQINAGRYGNVSEYFRDLVRRDQERREAAIDELRVMLDRAEVTGISERSVGEVLQAAREEAQQKGLLRDEN